MHTLILSHTYSSKSYPLIPFAIAFVFVMASLLLLASELLKHSHADLAYSTSTPLPFSSCGATTSAGVPCFTHNTTAKMPEFTPARDQFCNMEEEDSMEDIADLRICVVDIVWP